MDEKKWKEMITVSCLQVTPCKKGPVNLIVPFPQETAFDEDTYYESWQYTTLSTLDEVRAAVEKHFGSICRYGMVPFVCSVSKLYAVEIYETIILFGLTYCRDPELRQPSLVNSVSWDRSRSYRNCQRHFSGSCSAGYRPESGESHLDRSRSVPYL